MAGLRWFRERNSFVVDRASRLIYDSVRFNRGAQMFRGIWRLFPKNKNRKQPCLFDVAKGNDVNVSGARLMRGRVIIHGAGNRLMVEDGASFNGTLLIKGNNNTVRIGSGAKFTGQIRVPGGRGQTVDFGDHSTTVNVYILCHEGCDVRIGRWCMFSREIEIRTTDAHSVIDRETRMRLNKPKSITVGDHVWVGVGAIINKGARIPSDSIVGAMSFVNGKFDESGVVIAGTPAKIVKRGITWDRSRKPEFDQSELDLWK